MSGETKIVWDGPEAVAHFRGTPVASLDVAVTAWEAGGARFSAPIGDGMDDLDDGGRMAVATAGAAQSTHRFAVHDDGDGSAVFLFVEASPDAARAAAIEVIAALVADGLVAGDAVRDLYPSTSGLEQAAPREPQIDTSLPVRFKKGEGVVVRAESGGVMIVAKIEKGRRFKRDHSLHRRVVSPQVKMTKREAVRVAKLQRFELTSENSEIIIESRYDGERN
jgi:hypothetical protein